MANKEVQIIVSAKDLATQTFDSLGNTLKRRKTDIQAFGATLAGVGAAITAGVGAIVYTSATAADEIDALAKRTGMAREEIQALAYAAKQEATDINTLGTSMARMSRQMLDAASGSKTAKDAFTSIGVSITDSQGNLRSATDVMMDVADKMKNMSNETEASAVAMKLFGRSGYEIVPFLKQGGDEIRRMMERARELGLVVDEEAMQELAALLDQIDEIKDTMAGWGRQLAADLLPHIRSFLTLVQSVGAWFRGWPPGLRSVISLVGSFAGTISLAAGTLILLIPKIAGVVTAIKGLQITLATFSIGTAIIAAIGLLIGMFAKAAEKARLMKLEISSITELGEAQDALGVWEQKYNQMLADRERVMSLPSNIPLNKQMQDAANGPEATRLLNEAATKVASLRAKIKELANPVVDTGIDPFTIPEIKTPKVKENIPTLEDPIKTYRDFISALADIQMQEELLGSTYDGLSDRLQTYRNEIQRRISAGEGESEETRNLIGTYNELIATQERLKASNEALAKAPGWAEVIADSALPLIERAKAMIEQFRNAGKSEADLMLESIDAQIAAYEDLAIAGDRNAQAYIDMANALRRVRNELAGIIPVAQDVAEAISGNTEENPFTSGWQSFRDAIGSIREGIFRGSTSRDREQSMQWGASNLGGALLSGMPIMNSVVQGVAQGAILGPAGMLAGALVPLITQSETFADILANINPLLQSVADMVGAFLEPLIPLVVVISSALSPAISVLTTIMSSLLLPVMQALFPVFKALGLAVIGLSIGIGTAWNAIATAINWALGWLGVNLKMVDTEGLAESFNALLDLTWENAMAQGEAADAANECANALRNVPSGFKIALERFRAAEGIGGGSGGYSTPTPPINPKQPGYGPPIQVLVQGNVYGVDEMERVVGEAWTKIQSKTNLAGSGLALAGV